MKKSKSQLPERPLLPLMPTFWIHLHLLGNGTEWMDEGLPTPNYLYHSNDGYFIAWQIDGYFATKKGIEYLNDIIGRVTITLNDLKPNRLPYKPDTKEELAHYYPKIYKLLAFKGAKSLSKKTHAPVRADNLGGRDYCFWAIKLYTEDLIRQFGEGTPLPYHLMEDWACNAFVEHNKGLSTVKAKCRSVWNWNDQRGWTLPKHYIKKYTQEEYEMTRRERAIINAEMAEKKSRRKIINIVTGLMKNEYKKKSGSWHISKIAKDVNLTRNTVSKHLKEMGLL